MAIDPLIDGPARSGGGRPDSDKSVGRSVMLYDATCVEVPAGTGDPPNGGAPGALFPEAQRKLNLSEEEFARKYVLYRNATRAYADVYDCGNMKRTTITVHAYHMAHRPHIERRCNELISEAAAAARLDLQALLVEDYLIATSGRYASELSRIVIECCRYCYGELHGHQWIDATEYAVACSKVMEDNAERAERKQKLNPMPGCEGGFGFEATRAPNSECPQCRGRGKTVTVFADTSSLTGRAAVLYRGVRETSNGIEILQHDIDKAKDRIYKANGLYGDDAASVARAAGAGAAAGAAAAAGRIQPTMSPDDAARAYLELSQ